MQELLLQNRARDRFNVTMSLYTVQKLLFHLNNDARVASRFDAQRDTLLGEYELSAAERAAVASGNVGALYMMGVPPLLLAPFGGRCGLAWPDHLAALKRARESAPKVS